VYHHVSSLADRLGLAGPLVIIVPVLAFVLLMQYRESVSERRDFLRSRITWVFASALVLAVAMMVAFVTRA